ncbi:hypothetical protein [Peribacillus alkalitolerans]|nr:hypothetical protein [Peribacillus alkalitolerans]
MNAVTFPICVDPFTILWNYEFGTLDHLPSEIDSIIGDKARGLGLIE